MSGFRLAVVSLVDGHTQAFSDRGPRIQTSRSKSSQRWFLRLSGFRLAVVSLVDGHEFPVVVRRRFETSSGVSLVDGGFVYCPNSD